MDTAPLHILYVLPYVPSPIRVRPYQIIRALAQAGHRVTLAALDDGSATPDSLAELRAVCDAVHVIPHSPVRGALQALAALPTPTPLWAAYCHSGAMDAALRQLAATGAFDVAHVEHLRAAHFAPALKPLPLVLDAVDCITALREQMMNRGDGSPAARLLSWQEWAKLRAYEPRVYRPFARIAVTAEQDRAELRRLDGALPPITVVPNGVDAEYFRPDPHALPEPDTVVFSGKMSYEANADAARFLLGEILPRLRQSRPGAKAILVGSSPPASLKALAARTGGVTLTGFVDDIRPFLLRGSVAVCPMRIGVGMQNKVLEAMAAGRPVVCSPIAARALPDTARTANGVYVADGSVAFAAVCSELLSRPADELAAAGREARAFVEPRYRWSATADELIRLYDTVVADRRNNRIAATLLPPPTRPKIATGVAAD